MLFCALKKKNIDIFVNGKLVRKTKNNKNK